uniref:Seminal fluid protein n=1 Tax=Nilaparvata lugens TaxID=108931 RepID=A0A1I9WL94_NILLU|nr:seminal fluid protein [Nilaparvata lugens]
MGFITKMDSHCPLIVICLEIMTMVIVSHACQNGRIYDNKVTGNDIQTIVNTHNNLRAMVARGQLRNQPPAQNMQQMTWDSQLAQRAQYWANQCVYAHDKNRGNDVGQNIAQEYFSGHSNRQHNFTKVIYDLWFSEHVRYRYKKLGPGDSSDPATATGHYTQIVWANTNRVGCGFASYYQTQKRQDQIFYVCNYAPSGNFIGQYPYISGDPNCRANGLSNSNINGLCRR